MNYTYQLLVTAALSITIPSVSAMATSPSNTKQEIQKSYNQIASAILRKDVRVATSYFTKDYVSIDNKGNRYNAEDMRRYYNSIMTDRFKIIKNQISIQDFSANSNIAQVVVKQRADLTVGNNKVVSQNTYRDVWVNTPQGWRLKQSHNTGTSTTVNGKPVST